MGKQKKILALFLIMVLSVVTVAATTTNLTISGPTTETTSTTYFFDESVLNIQTENETAMWNFLEVSLNNLASINTFYEYQPIDTTFLTYQVNRVLYLAEKYQSNPLYNSDTSGLPYHVPIVGPTMHQSIFIFEGGLTYKEVSETEHNHEIPIIGLRPENYGTINYHIVRAAEEMERLRALENTYSNVPSSIHDSGSLPYRFGEGFNPSVLRDIETGFDSGRGMTSSLFPVLIHSNGLRNLSMINPGVERTINTFSEFEGGNLERVPHVAQKNIYGNIPVSLTNGRFLYNQMQYVINYANTVNKGIYIYDFTVLNAQTILLNFVVDFSGDYNDVNLRFPLAVYNTSNDARILVSSSVEIENVYFSSIANVPITSLPAQIIYVGEEEEDELITNNLHETYYENEQKEHENIQLQRERRREIVVITPYGRVTIGDEEYIFDPLEFGAPHINDKGVSVLPARRILSILLGEDPHNNEMFIWDGASANFKIDPYNYSILFTVNRPVMRVGGRSTLIFSGSGSGAFLTPPYIDINQNERLFVPTRTLAEILGFNVYWDFESANVTLIPIELDF